MLKNSYPDKAKTFEINLCSVSKLATMIPTLISIEVSSKTSVDPLIHIQIKMCLCVQRR